jgi:hypothetical protein
MLTRSRNGVPVMDFGGISMDCAGKACLLDFTRKPTVDGKMKSGEGCKGWSVVYTADGKFVASSPDTDPSFPQFADRAAEGPKIWVCSNRKYEVVGHFGKPRDIELDVSFQNQADYLILRVERMVVLSEDLPPRARSEAR